LQKIVRDADSGRRYTDKLVKVYTLAGDEIWVLIHIEIQGKADGSFNERLYRYNYRLVDCYPQHKVASFAVLTNQLNCKDLGCYQQSLWGTQMKFDFPVLNLQLWSNRFAELEANPNPFAVIILAQLIAHNTTDKQLLFEGKFRLIRQLYQRGYDRQDILELFRFIDWMLLLPKELELQLKHEVIKIEEEQKMAYVTSIERFAKEEGETKGEIKGEAQTLLVLLKLKFGSLPEWAELKINSADKDQLDLWVEKFLTAESVESLLGY